MYVARARLPAGEQRIAVRVGGTRRERTVTVKPGGWAFVNVSDVR